MVHQEAEGFPRERQRSEQRASPQTYDAWRYRATPGTELTTTKFIAEIRASAAEHQGTAWRHRSSTGCANAAGARHHQREARLTGVFKIFATTPRQLVLTTRYEEEVSPDLIAWDFPRRGTGSSMRERGPPRLSLIGRGAARAHEVCPRCHEFQGGTVDVALRLCVLARAMLRRPANPSSDGFTGHHRGTRRLHRRLAVSVRAHNEVRVSRGRHSQGEDQRAGASDISRRGEQDQPLLDCPPDQVAERCARGLELELRTIPTTELWPARRIVAVPPTQLVRRGELTTPARERSVRTS